MTVKTRKADIGWPLNCPCLNSHPAWMLVCVGTMPCPEALGESYLIRRGSVLTWRRTSRIGDGR